MRKFKLATTLAPAKPPSAANIPKITLDEGGVRSPSYRPIVQKGHRMAQIDELEQRISVAFARISAGVVSLAAQTAAPAPEPAAPAPEPAAPDLFSAEPAAPDDAELLRVTEALDEERMANAQLNERLRHLQDQSAATATTQQALVDSLTRQLDAQGLDVQRLSSTVAQVREDLRRLREAAEQGIVDPALINRAMMAELEALRTTRAAESTEMADILSALGTVLDAEEARPHA